MGYFLKIMVRWKESASFKDKTFFKFSKQEKFFVKFHTPWYQKLSKTVQAIRITWNILT